MSRLLLKVLSRIRWELIILLSRLLSINIVTGLEIRKIHGLKRIGSRNCGWIVPTHLLGEESICYCVGVGVDITFDLGLISRFNCEVYAYDPTPMAKLHVQKHAQHVNQFHFFDVGLWDKNEVVRFYAPANPSHISHSVLNLQGTNEFFEAQCKRLSTIMSENGHQKIGLLKLDIEGAEYRVIDSIIEDRLDIGVICVEYHGSHHKLDDGYLDRIRESVSRLHDYGYTLVAVSLRCDYTFVKNELLNL
jgi:FkbM family methyltransferase